MKFGVFALTSLLLAFARPASAEDCHLLYRGGIPADTQEPRLPSPLPCRPGPATNDLDRIWIDTSGGFTPDPTRVDLVVQAVNAARGLFRVPASGVGGIDLLLSSGHDTRYGRSGDPRFGSVRRDDHTRCLVVLNRNTERLSAPHLQQYVAKAVSACAFRDYFHPEQATWFTRVGANPALAWWTQTLSTYMSAAV
ncbi:MAG: hypothetical protein JNJ59_03675, partial [Deltaproteobacteria bacterium]|nr:hypothetical protein [Deltaproteobacteria bacterium]